LEASNTTKRNDWRTLKRVFSLSAPFRKLFFWAMLAGIAVSIVGPVRPFLIQQTVDKYILTFDSVGLRYMSILLVITLVAEFVLRYAFGYLSTWLGQSVIKDLRRKVFSHVLSLKLRYFDRTPIGTVTTRTINDVEAVNNIFAEGIITIIVDILTLLFVIGFMLAINWKLTLVCLSTFPLVIIATYIFKEKVRVSFHEVREKVAAMNAFVQEHITGMRFVQIFNANKREAERFDAINADHRDANLKSVWYFSLFFPIVEIILALAIGLMVWYGAGQVMDNTATIGVFTSFILYLNMAFRPLRMLADKFNTLQMGIVAAERVFRLLDTQEKIEDDGLRNATDMKGSIDFEHVWFAYQGENYVLKDVSFSVAPGETLAIVGATGSGKTSIINLLSRFYEVNKGEIRIDGISTREYQLEALRGSIGVVLQDVFLFSGTVMENITLKNDDIPFSKVEEAARIVGAHEFILSLPGGYNYPVMERGATLSVGQRQIISFIRALVYNPIILVLDEATSSVDTESEQLIQQAIEKLISGRTSIVIAHRLSTIQKADKIMVLEKGEVMEAGTHRQLLKIPNGHYRRLYEMQFQEQEIVG
jgi:ATP-binding cassette, subfamily B, multidrug efflux pump